MKIIKPAWFAWLTYPPANCWETRCSQMQDFRDRHASGAILTLCHPRLIHIAWGPDATALANLLNLQIVTSHRDQPLIAVPNLLDCPLNCTILRYTELHYTGPLPPLATSSGQFRLPGF